MDFVKYSPWLVPLILAAMVALTVTLIPEQNAGEPPEKTSSSPAKR
jgi:hypothetical protein